MSLGHGKQRLKTKSCAHARFNAKEKPYCVSDSFRSLVRKRSDLALVACKLRFASRSMSSFVPDLCAAEAHFTLLTLDVSQAALELDQLLVPILSFLAAAAAPSLTTMVPVAAVWLKNACRWSVTTG